MSKTMQLSRSFETAMQQVLTIILLSTLVGLCISKPQRYNSYSSNNVISTTGSDNPAGLGNDFFGGKDIQQE